MTRRLLSPDPVLTSDELEALGHRVLDLTTADTVELTIENRAQGVTRVRDNRVRSTNDGSAIQLSFLTRFGQHEEVRLDSNQLDDASLRASVAYAERVAREMPGDPYVLHMPTPKRTIPKAQVWHDSTVAALATTRHAVLPTLIDAVVDANLTASAFVGVVARSVLHLTKDGVNVSGHETDAEIILTAWTSDGSGVGWAGQAAREWTTLDPRAVAAGAIHLAQDGVNPVAVEPGRRTVILGPAAVAQFVHAMSYAWDAAPTNQGFTPFSGKMGKRVMDSRITMSSDPNDPDGGYLPFFKDGADGSPTVPMTWIDHGVLVNLAYHPYYTASLGRSAPSNDIPYSLRLGQGPATIDSMVAQCREGIYVNRVANLVTLSSLSGVMTGVTQGGCFLVKDGKITKPVKNLRFVDSPFLFFNNVIDIGTPQRAALGYTAGADEWPLPPIIVPPLMIRDFNFTMLADAV